MIAVLAFEVFKDVFIHHLTQLGTSNTTCRTVKKRTEKCTSHRACSNTNRASDHSNFTADIGTCQCSSGTADGTTRRSDDATIGFSSVFGDDVRRIAFWTNRVLHRHTFQSKQEACFNSRPRDSL